MNEFDRRLILEDTVRRVNEWLDAQDPDVSGSAVASMLLRRSTAAAELEQLPNTGEQSKRDELKARRKKREAARRTASS